MVSVLNEADWQSLQDLFDKLWPSATIRLSLLEVDGTTVPNGEIVFHRESRPEEATVEYAIDGFQIYEETVSNPLEVVHGLFYDDLQIRAAKSDVEFTHVDGSTSGYFQTGFQESRVFGDRPLVEFNTVFKPELTADLEEGYQNVIDDIDERIKTAGEPFFDVAKCEYYYFDHHFRGKSTVDPMVLVFADPDIRIDVDDDNELELQFPVALQDDLMITVYPRRPHGEQKGWKIPMADREFEASSNGLVMHTETLHLGELQEVDIVVFVGDRLVKQLRHHNSKIETENDRFRIYEKYDQRGELRDYLQGKDPNQFEVAVLNLLGLAGYVVQWFGDDSFSIPNYSRETTEPLPGEIDIVAHAPDDSHIAFVECTNQGISEKMSLLDRMKNVTSDIVDEGEIRPGLDPEWAKSTVPCIATPQSPEGLSSQIVENLEDMGIVVLHSEKLLDIYEASADQRDLVEVGGDPGRWWDQRI